VEIVVVHVVRSNDMGGAPPLGMIMVGGGAGAGGIILMIDKYVHDIKVGQHVRRGRVAEDCKRSAHPSHTHLQTG
jgi:hypothetical protein